MKNFNSTHYGSHYSKNYHKNHAETSHVDISSLEKDLRRSFQKRSELQSAMDQYWKEVHQGYDRHIQIGQVTREIGCSTHHINQLLSKLCQYKHASKVMNMAYGYIDGEINRIRKIISNWEHTIHQVNNGHGRLIDSYGHVSTDCISSQNYVAQKRKQLQLLERWRDYVSHYLVR